MAVFPHAFAFLNRLLRTGNRGLFFNRGLGSLLGRRRRKEDIPDDQDRCRKSDGDQRVLIHVGDSNSEKPYVPEPGQLLRDEKDDT